MKNQFRLRKEKKENETPSEFFYIQPLPHDMYQWHFTMRGMPGSSFEGGLYHGFFQLPENYPWSPPDIYFMNNSGRFAINTKICLTITSYHKEEWTPAWTLRTMMEAVCSFFTYGSEGYGSLSDTDESRKIMAVSSKSYICPDCGPVTLGESLILDGLQKKSDIAKLSQIPLT